MNPRFHCKSYVVKSRIGIENIGSQILEKSAARHLRSGAILAGEMEFDLALLLSQNRSLTQRAATAIYALGFDGIFYQSRHGADLFNWALFEPFNLKDPIEAEIPFTDPDFQEALRRLDLNFDDMR